MTIKTFAAGVAVAAIMAGSASAAELVTNGGFETGSLSGWSLTGNTGFSSVITSPVHSGSFAYSNGAVGSFGTLSQTVATVAGQSYTYSFWLAGSGSQPNDFQARLGNVLLQSLSTSGQGYINYTGSVVADATNATLAFSFRHDPSFWQFDDASLVSGAVPEPATWAMMLTGFFGAGAFLRRRRMVVA